MWTIWNKNLWWGLKRGKECAAADKIIWSAYFDLEKMLYGILKSKDVTYVILFIIVWVTGKHFVKFVMSREWKEENPTAISEKSKKLKLKVIVNCPRNGIHLERKWKHMPLLNVQKRNCQKYTLQIVHTFIMSYGKSFWKTVYDYKNESWRF